jgi:hypothetical protein
MTPEPPDSPPVWWTCEGECGKCPFRLCPERPREDPDLPDAIEERDDYEPRK